MPRITVNPDVESAGGFPVWAEGTYRMRVDGVKEMTSKKGGSMLNVTLSPIDTVNDKQGNALSSPGKLFDYVMVEPYKMKNGGTVSFLRPFVESCGLNWSDFDSDELVGKECTVKVGIEVFEGSERNKRVAYVKAS